IRRRPAYFSGFKRGVGMKAINCVVWAVLALAVTFTTGCQARHTNNEVYYLTWVSAALPYWQTAAAGFKEAASQYKVTAKVVGPDGHDPDRKSTRLNSSHLGIS